MAVNWRLEGHSPTVDSLKRRVVPACVAGALLVGGINLLSGWLVDVESRKVTANQIVSPFDKKQIPPVLAASDVVTVKKERVKPVIQNPEKQQVVKHRVRRHHWRRHHWARRARSSTRAAADNTGYQSF